MQLGKSIISTELDKPEAPKEDVGLFKKYKSVMYEYNILGAYAINNNTKRLTIDDDEIDNEKKSGYKFSYSDPYVQEATKDFTAQDWEDFPFVDTLYEFKKHINRREELKKAAEINEDVALPWKLGAGLLDVDLIAGGVIAKPFQLGAKMFKASRAAQVTTAGLIGATDAAVSDRMLQAQHGSDKALQTGYAMMFGGAGGAILGGYLSKNATKVSEDGTTFTDRIVKDAMDSEKHTIGNASDAVLKKNSVLKYITPVSKMLSSTNAKAVELAGKLFSPVKALTNKVGDLIPTGLNGNWYKQQVKKEEHLRQRNLDLVFKEAKRNGYSGNYKAFQDEYLNHYRKASKKAHEKAYKNLDDVSEETIASITVKTNFKHKNKFIQQAAEIENNYYKTIGAQAGDAKIKGFTNLNKDGYLNRNYLIKKMKENPEEFIVDLAAAMAKHPTNRDKKFSTLTKQAKKVYEKQLQAEELKAIQKHTDIKHMKASNKRTLQYYDADMAKWLDGDLESMASKYNYNMAGKIGLQRGLGISNFAEYSKMRTKLFKDKELSKEELEDLDILVETMLDSRGLQTDPKGLVDTTVRIAAKSSRALYSPNFVLSGFAELAQVINGVGVVKTLSSFVPALKTVTGLLSSGKISKKHEDLYRLVKVGDVLSARNLNRYDTEDVLQSSRTGVTGVLEGTLDKVNHYIHKAGLGPITEVGKLMAAETGMDWIITLAKKGKLSTSEAKALARMGLDTADLKQINKLVKDGTIKEGSWGNVSDYNIRSWDKQLSDRVSFALDNHITSTILDAGAEALPGLVSKGDFVGKIMMQFTRFPIASYEKLLIKNLDEADASRAVSLMTTVGFFTMVSIIKDEAKGRKHDFNTEEGLRHHILYGIANTPIGSLPSVIYDKAGGLTGATITSRGDYVPSATSAIAGPFGGALDKTARGVHRVVNGDAEDAVFDNPGKHYALGIIAVDKITELLQNK